MCVECEDQPACIFCEQCADDFCRACFEAIHRKGSRRGHKSRPLEKPVERVGDEDGTLSTVVTSSSTAAQPQVKQDVTIETGSPDQQRAIVDPDPLLREGPSPNGAWFAERAKWIPLRLTFTERKEHRLLEAALQVSEYTDKVDIVSWKSPYRRMVAQLKELCAILSGLVVACDFTLGQQLIKDRRFAQYEHFFQHMFELGRRYKIMNPDKMRGTYGKLVCLLMDSQIPEVREMLEFEMVRPLDTAYGCLERHGCTALLEDPHLGPATTEIFSEGKDRWTIKQEIRRKEAAIEHLARKYSNAHLPPDAVKRCIYSIGDNHSFLRTNRDPCDKMIHFLRRHFDPATVEPGHSLEIRFGRGGARLSHDHRLQYNYVLQTLTLWRAIAHDFFRLWCLAEMDLLSKTSMYRLRDTGQGLNRLQAAPRVGRAMQEILSQTQRKLGSWVGSSVVHLGDTNVPNALMFIDKYTQVARILNPIVLCIEKIGALADQSPALRQYFDTGFGGVERLRKLILGDFFRYGFDGSGADNFFDAGSCIDGRLTSAWNWCSKLEKKPFFPVFLLAGFIGFDGNFQQ
eukprot:gnl/Trimastix_PCT/546.p1 GENE.gnl/Trimastix_PCT/546~~gnl/Trimastix_PCT/546.p1  ORF type:complete len:633 (+),score=189.49 gnl/Trimastix_PCT/546:188-1900(+)